jgi:hypothetical protein
VEPLREPQIRFAFQMLTGRVATPEDLVPLRAIPGREALRQAILAVAGATAAAALAAPVPAPPVMDVDPADLALLRDLGAGAAAEPGFVVDWFGLRTPALLAPEMASLVGSVLPLPVPTDPRASAADWIGLARSVAESRGTWRALATGAGRGDLLLSGAVAARRRGLALDLHASEPAPEPFAALLEHAAANALDAGAHRFQQAVIGTAAADLPARGGTVQDLLAEAPAWDWVRIAPRGTLFPLLQTSTPLLTQRVRMLSLVTHNRAEEALAVRMLPRDGWTLVAETPSLIGRAAPGNAVQPGTQVWRGPLA